MNIRHTLAIVALVSFLASCVRPPPIQNRPATGNSLDRPVSGARSARETRYLEEEVSQAPQAMGAPMDPNLDPNAQPVTDAGAVQAPTGDAPPSPTTEQPAVTATPPPVAATPPPAASELPYGVPVPGKKGFVYSPYDKSAGFVDVRDIGPGTKVRCPYTGKIFRVP